MKVKYIFAVVLMLCCILSACEQQYRNDLTARAIVDIAEGFIDEDVGTKLLDDDIILEFTDGELPFLLDYAVIKSNNSKNISEIGVFIAAEGFTDDVYELVSEYLNNKQRIYRSMNYFPKEAVKIDNASVRIIGNYVIYSFLNERDTETFFSAVKMKLKK